MKQDSGYSMYSTVSLNRLYFRKAHNEKSEKRKSEKYKKVFKFHLKKLRSASHRISQTLELSTFIKVKLIPPI